MNDPMPFVPHTAGRSASASSLDIAAHAMVASRLSDIASLRGAGGPASAPPLPPRFLRHADEQTVVGVHAVLAAIAGLADPPSLESHGVIAASCQAGRIGAAQTLVQADQGGGVAVSTHVIPQGSLHSPAGAVSVALGMHGPNIGVSGGPDALSEGMLAAFSWLHGPARGIRTMAWLVITGWDEEPLLDAAGAAVSDPVCRAVAIALVRPAAEESAAAGRLVVTFEPHDRPAVSSSGSLQELGESLAEHARFGATPCWSHRFPWGGRVELAVSAAARLREAA